MAFFFVVSIVGIIYAFSFNIVLGIVLALMLIFIIGGLLEK